MQLFHAQAKQASPNPNEQQSVTSCSAFVGKVPVTHSAQEQLLLNVQPGSDDAKASKPVGQLNSSPDPEGEHILHLLQEHMVCAIVPSSQVEQPPAEQVLYAFSWYMPSHLAAGQISTMYSIPSSAYGSHVACPSS